MITEEKNSFLELRFWIMARSRKPNQTKPAAWGVVWVEKWKKIGFGETVIVFLDAHCHKHLYEWNFEEKAAEADQKLKSWPR